MNTKQILTIGAATALLCTPAFALRAPKTSPTPNAASPAPAATAGSQTTAAASPGAKADRAIPFHGMISSVDAKAKTFSIAGKEKTRTFKITDKTVITKTGQPATMKDVVANEEARGSYWKMPDGTLDLKTLKVGPPTEQEKAAEEARKTKHEAKKNASPSGSASPSASATPTPSASPH